MTELIIKKLFVNRNCEIRKVTRKPRDIEIKTIFEII